MTLSQDIIKWLEKEVKTNRNYRNKSHLIEVALANLKKETETKRE